MPNNNEMIEQAIAVAKAPHAYPGAHITELLLALVAALVALKRED